MKNLTNPVSSDVTNSTPEATKPVKSAKQIAAAEALKAMSLALSPERGVKAKEHRSKVAENKKTNLGQKLALLTAGNFEHKGKRKSLNVRATVIEMVKAARLGATQEQLALTGVAKRFQWVNIEGPVRAYAAVAGEHSVVVLAVLYPVAVASTEDKADESAKSDPKKTAAKPPVVKRPAGNVQAVKKTG